MLSSFPGSLCCGVPGICPKQLLSVWLENHLEAWQPDQNLHISSLPGQIFFQFSLSEKISEKALSTIEEYIPGRLEENGQLPVTEDHQSESTGSESESDLGQ